MKKVLKFNFQSKSYIFVRSKSEIRNIIPLPAIIIGNESTLTMTKSSFIPKLSGEKP